MLITVRIIRWLTGSAKKMGLSGRKINRIYEMAGLALEQFKILNLPDQFNKTFSEDGWIATGSMSVEIMQKALKFHHDGDKQAAEEVIMAWFNEDSITRFAINGSKRFSKEGMIRIHRWHQLQEALQLTLDERYWSAVPLILIVCDGFASDILGFSPFKKDADLTVFDSITGHPNSLPFLIKKITKGVQKTSSDELVFPLRHGILHGRSLGYANRTVCMKAWHLMIALIDWAEDRYTEEDRKKERNQTKKINFRDLAVKMSKFYSDRRILEAFEPRESSAPFVDGEMCINSPEYAVVKFLKYWRQRNYGKMAGYAVNLMKEPINSVAGEIRDMADFASLTHFEIRSVNQHAVAGAKVVVYLKGSVFERVIEGAFSVSVFRYTSEGEIAMPDDEGKWHVQQNFIYDFCNQRVLRDGQHEFYV